MFVGREERRGGGTERESRDNSIFILCRGKCALTENYSWSRAGWANILYMSQIANISSFAGNKVSVATIQLCRCSIKAATDNT